MDLQYCNSERNTFFILKWIYYITENALKTKKFFILQKIALVNALNIYKSYFCPHPKRAWTRRGQKAHFIQLLELTEIISSQYKLQQKA